MDEYKKKLVAIVVFAIALVALGTAVAYAYYQNTNVASTNEVYGNYGQYSGNAPYSYNDPYASSGPYSTNGPYSSYGQYGGRMGGMGRMGGYGMMR